MKHLIIYFPMYYPILYPPMVGFPLYHCFLYWYNTIQGRKHLMKISTVGFLFLNKDFSAPDI